MANENRLPAETQGDLVRCCICKKLTRSIHWHHTVPRSLGGEHSLQIPIDGDCHTTLHAKSEAVVGRLNGKRKKPVGEFWADVYSEQAAEPWLRILVDAMLNPPVDASQKTILLPSISVDVTTRHALELLKRDTPGITSMSQVLRYCVDTVLKQRGLKDDRTQTTPNTGRKSTGKKRTSLW
ncbi:hypothetical protein fHeYen902_234 [Yersinia phage fHe-Yen9-02]|nr:hypothetical protein fHeYen902_234 [Yersinia phage fHe-Yen9-02]